MARDCSASALRNCHQGPSKSSCAGTRSSGASASRGFAPATPAEKDRTAGPPTIGITGGSFASNGAARGGAIWDDAGLFVVKYGFHTYGFDRRTGTLRWSHRSASPLIAVFGSPRLPHLLVQSEIETFAIEADGTVGWRIAHSDVVIEAALVGGRLVLTSFGGLVSAVDPLTGRPTEG